MKYEVWALKKENELFIKEIHLRDFSGLGAACSYAYDLSVKSIYVLNVYSNVNGFRHKISSYKPQ